MSELHYHPAPPTPAELAALNGVTNDDFEFIELVNHGTSALALTGMSFTAGVVFSFPAATLAPGARVVIAKRPAAFLLRHPGFTGLLGGYEGNLDNGGERLELTEASGEVVVDFAYDDLWYPVSDGSGYSLVLRDPATEAAALGLAASWVMSPAWDWLARPGGHPRHHRAGRPRPDLHRCRRLCHGDHHPRGPAGGGHL